VRLIQHAVAIALLCLPALAAAADEPPPRWTIGAVVIDRDMPYRGFDEGLLVLPLVRFEGERFYVRGLRGGVVLAEGNGFGFGPFLQLRTDGYRAEDSDFLAGMDDRRFSFDGGVAGTWRNENFGQLELSLATDVMGRHHGQEVEFSYTALFKAGGWTFVPALAAKWQSEELVDYYWGVRADEALPVRPEYHAGAAVVPELSLLATRRFGAWTLYARVAHSWLPGEIADSPIVERDARTGIALGIGWSPD
jgi:outer membrane protein